MSSKSIGFIVIAAGLILLVLSASADFIGIGGAPGFGWKQIAGSVGGLLIAIVGFLLANRKSA